MPPQRRGFASINTKTTQQKEQRNDAERIEAIEARLVKRFQDALARIADGRNDAAKQLLWQLLQEPLLLQQGQSHKQGLPATAALQSRLLQGMHYKVLSSLAPLLGQSPEALDIWCQVIQQDPCCAKAWEESSIILAHMGQLHLAVQAADIALRLKPDSIVLLERLIVLFAARSDWTGAGQLLLDLARLTGACHRWLTGLFKVTPRATGFSQDDIKHCLQEQYSLVEYLAQQARATAVRVYQQQHEQTQSLLRILQVSSVCDLLQQLLQVLGNQLQSVRSTSSAADVDMQGMSSPLKGNLKSPQMNSSSGSNVAVHTLPAANAGKGSNTNATAAVADAAPAVQLKVCFVAPSAMHGLGSGQQCQIAPGVVQAVTSIPSGMHQATPPSEVQSFPGNPSNGAVESCHHSQPVQAVQFTHQSGSCSQQQPEQQQPVGPLHQQQQQQHTECLRDSSVSPKETQAAQNTVGASGKHTARPPAGAFSGTGRGADSRKPSGQQMHKPIITALQLVKDVIGRWLPNATPSSDSTEAEAVSHGSPVKELHAELPELQHQQLQPPSANARHTTLVSNTKQVRHAERAADCATSAKDAGSAGALTWLQFEQALLQRQSLQPFSFPLHLTTQLLKELLSAAEQFQLPIQVCHLLLQLARHVPMRLFSQQQHLVLAELYLDAALSVRAAGEGLGQHSMAGTHKVLATAVDPSAAGTKHVALSIFSKKRPHAAAAASTAVQSADAEGLMDGLSAGSAATAAQQLAGECHTSVQNSAAADPPPSKRPNTGRPIIRQRRQRLQGAAQEHASNCVDVCAASGGQSRAEKRLEQLKADAVRQQQQRKAEQQVKQLLYACERHLQQFEAARMYSQYISSVQTSAAAPVGEAASADTAEADHVADIDSLWCNSMWTHGDECMHSLCVLKTIWVQQVTRMCSQQQHWRVSNNGVLAAQLPPLQQQQQQPSTASRQHNIDPAWLCILGDAATSSSGTSSTTQAGRTTIVSLQNDSSNAGDVNSCDFSSCWGPSLTGWHTATCQEQQQQQGGRLDSMFAPNILHEDWGPVLQVPAVVTAATEALHPAVVGADFDVAAPQLQAEPSRLGVEALNSYLQQTHEDVQVQQQRDGVMQGPMQPGAEGTSDKEAATIADAADLRRWWVIARLRETQDDLEAADAASQQCLSWLAAATTANVQTGQGGRQTSVTAAPDGVVALEAAQPAQVSEGRSQPLLIQLPSCQHDASISKAAVQQRQDFMWLKKQLAAASEQLHEQDQLYKQLQQRLLMSPEEKPGNKQQGHEQSTQALLQQQKGQDDHLIRQLVKDISGIADSIFNLLSQRCLRPTSQDEVTQLQLSGIKLVQRAANRATAAADEVQAALVSDQPQQYNCASYGLSTQEDWLQPMQLQQTRFRRIELQCILLQLHRALCLHQVPETLSHVAASHHANQVSSGVHTSSAANTAAHVMHCLRDLNRFWDSCRQKPSGLRNKSMPATKHKAQQAAAAPAACSADKQQQQVVGTPNDDQLLLHTKKQHMEDMRDVLPAEMADSPDHTVAARGAQAGHENGTAALAAPGHAETAAEAFIRATEALAAAKAKESPQLSEQLLLQELKLHNSLLSLLQQVQQLLQELLATRCFKQLDFSAVAAAVIAGSAADRKQLSAAAGVAAAEGSGAQPSGRARTTRAKRHRHMSSAAAGEAVTGTAAAAVDALASGSAALRGGSGRGLHGRGRLSLTKSQGKVLLQEAAYGLLAVHELDPSVSGNAESVLGMIEGLYSLLSLRVSVVDMALARFLRAAWHRLKLVFHKLLQQQEQHDSQQQQQQQLLLRVDQALAQILWDLHGLNLPWRSRTFGHEPLIASIAAAAAREVAATAALHPQMPGALAARSMSLGSVAAEASTEAAPQSIAAASEKQHVQTVDAEAIAAASFRALQQLYAMRLEGGVQHSALVQSHSTNSIVADVLGSCLFTPSVSKELKLEDLLEIWTYVSVRASPADIIQNHRINQCCAAPTSRKSKQIILAAATAAAAAASAPATNKSQQQHQAEVVQAAASGQSQQLQLSDGQASSMLIAANGPKFSASDSDESSSDDDGEDDNIWPTCALGMEERYWRQLQQDDHNIVQQLLQQLPPPPTRMVATTASWLRNTLDSTQQQLDQQAAKQGSTCANAIELLLSCNALSRWGHQALQAVAALGQPSSLEAAVECPNGSSMQVDTLMVNIPPVDAEPAGADAVHDYVDIVMTDAQGHGSVMVSPSAMKATAAGESAIPSCADQSLINPVYGWTADDLQVVLGERPVPGCPATSQAELQAADPLLEVHRLLYHAAGFQAPQSTAVSLDDGPSAAVTEYERLLLLDIAVRPSSIRPWQRLADLYSSILQANQSGLLEKATELAHADSWHAATEMKHWGGKPHSSKRQQQVQMLQHFSRRALRCTAMAAHLIQQVQHQQQQQQQYRQPSSELRDDEDLFVASDQVDQLGVMLRDAAMCLGPWYDPYRHKPNKTAAARQLLLHAAESCFCSAQQLQESGEWQFSFVVGQTAAKAKAQGWQERALSHYALACHQSRIKADPQSAVLLPYVKLHGSRLKLLTCAVVDGCGLAGSTADTGTLSGLLDLLGLLGRWCFNPEVKTKFDRVLEQLRESPLLQASFQPQQQALMMQLQRLVTQQDHQQQHAAGSHDLSTQEQLLQPWFIAVKLLLGDCCAALQYCQDCYSRPLVPARYSLARGLVKLGRYEEGFSVLEGLFKLSGSFASRNSAMPFPVSFLTEEGDIKPPYQPHARNQQHHHQGDAEDDDSEAAVPATTAGPGRKRRRISSTAAAASSVLRPSGDSDQLPVEHQTGQLTASRLTGDTSPESSWGLRPDVVRGWGEDESVRQFNTRNRRALLLYLEVLARKQDLLLLEQAYQGLLGRVGNLNGLLAEGLQPKDLGDLAVGLLLRQLLLDLAPALQQYQQTWQKQRQQQAKDISAEEVAAGQDSVIGIRDAAAACLLCAAANPTVQGEKASSAVPSDDDTMAAAPASAMSIRAQESAFRLGDSSMTQTHSQLQALVDAVADNLHGTSAARTDVDASQQECILSVLERAFALYVTWLQMMAPGDDERCLQLGKLLTAADEFLGVSQDGNTAAATVGARLLNEMQSDSKQIEHLLQLLAHAYIAAPAYHLQQSQQSTGVAASASSCPALIDKLKQAARLLKERSLKPSLKLSIQFQRCAKLMQSICQHTAHQLLLTQQLYLSAASATVGQHLSAKTADLEALELVPQQQAKASSVGDGVTTAPGVPQQQLADSMQVDKDVDAAAAEAAEGEGTNAVVLAKRRSLTPAPASPREATAEAEAATPEQPQETAAAHATPELAAAAAQTRASTPAQTPGGVAVEGRRSRRAAAAAAAGGHDQPAGGQISVQQSVKVPVIFSNPDRIAAVKAVLPVLKTVHQDFKPSNLASSIEDGKQYMQQLHNLVFDLLLLAAKSAGLPVAAVADSQTTPPNSDMRAAKVLQVAINCLSDLLKGVSTRHVVDESKAAAARLREQQQEREQQLQQQHEAERHQEQEQQQLAQQYEAEGQQSQDQQLVQQQAVDEQHKHQLLQHLKHGLSALVQSSRHRLLQLSEQRGPEAGTVEGSPALTAQPSIVSQVEHRPELSIQQSCRIQPVTSDETKRTPAASSLLQTFPQQQQQPQTHQQVSQQELQQSVSDTSSPMESSDADDDVELKQPQADHPLGFNLFDGVTLVADHASAVTPSSSSQKAAVTATAAEYLRKRSLMGMARAGRLAKAQAQGPSGGGPAVNSKSPGDQHGSQGTSIHKVQPEMPQLQALTGAAANGNGLHDTATRPADKQTPATACITVSGQQARDTLSQAFSGRGRSGGAQQSAVSGGGMGHRNARSRSHSSCQRFSSDPAVADNEAGSGPQRADHLVMSAEQDLHLAFPKPRQVEQVCTAGSHNRAARNDQIVAKAAATTAALNAGVSAACQQQGVMQQHSQPGVDAAPACEARTMQQVMPEQSRSLQSNSSKPVEQEVEEATAGEASEGPEDGWIQAFLTKP